MDPQVRATQAILAIRNPQLEVDGIPGNQTKAALQKATQEELNIVSRIKSLAPKEQKRGKWISMAKIVELSARVASVTGVPADYLVWITTNYEAEKAEIGGEVMYNAESVSRTGIHYGLTQFYWAAWQSAQRALNRIGVLLPGAFNGSRLIAPNIVYDPYYSLLAAAGLYLFNKDQARRLGYTGEFTRVVAYASHNQGHGVFTKNFNWTRLLGQQSGDAVRLLAQAKQQILA